MLCDAPPVFYVSLVLALFVGLLSLRLGTALYSKT